MRPWFAVNLGDFRRHAGQWQARRFVGDHGQIVRSAEEQRYILNTYRVLLTRARYETIIWVPPGSATDGPFQDITRPAAEMDAIAEFLLAAGAQTLENFPVNTETSPVPAQLL